MTSVPFRAPARAVRSTATALGLALTTLSTLALNAQTAPPPSGTPAQSAASVSPAPVGGGNIRGTIVAGTPGKAGATPLPGVAVTATNTLTGRRYTAATDIEGHYALSIPKNGRYVLKAELTGFALNTVEVVLNGDQSATHDFGLELASRAAEAEAQQQAATSGTTALSRGLQGLSLSGGSDAANTIASSAAIGNSGVSLPTLSGLDSTTGAASDSIAVSGQSGQMNGLSNFSEDEIHDRVQQSLDRARAEGRSPDSLAVAGTLGPMIMIGGGPGGPGGFGGPGGGPGGFGGGRGGFGGRGSGGFRNFNPAQPHGSLYYTGEWAALDSAPWSPTLTPVTNPGYTKNSFGASFMTSPYLPGLTKPSTRQFVFGNFSGQRDTTPQILTGTVPTAAERAGNFTGDQTIYDPLTGQPFDYNGANAINPTRLSSQALYLLNHFYPTCNVNCDGTGTNRYNYQTVTTAGQNSANASARYVRNIGQDAGDPWAMMHQHGNAPASLRQNINANGSYSHSASDQRNIFLLLGGATVSDGYNVGLGYNISRGRINESANVNWNRSHAQTRNYFTDSASDPASAAGIATPSDGAIGFRPGFYNGLPSITLNQFTSLSNTAPSETIGQTISFSDNVNWRPRHHSFRFGFDYRRQHQDSLGGSNPLGSLVFTGYNTQSPADQACTAGTTTDCSSNSGNSFADFLLGLPQQSKIQAGLAKIYLRENIYDLYAQDDFRVTGNLTLNYGVRYEYFAPFSEKNNRLVNLTGVSTYTTSIGCVAPDAFSVTTANGTLNCAAGPNSTLIHPDRTMVSPRFGLAWKPGWMKDTVLRTGYGINFNTSQFATFAKLLSYQPPYATVQNNVLATASNATGCSNANLTLADGFGCSNKLYQNSFGVNPNYRLGMVQVYNFDLQRTLPLGILLDLGYNGSHGNNLDVVRAPNQHFNTVTTTNAVAFTYEDSLGESTFNALTVNLRKRLDHGIGLNATYQYAHSIDNASTFGGASSTSSIQDDGDLHAERSNSSFDVRHSLTAGWVWEPPFGPNRAFLNKGGLLSAALDGIVFSGSLTATSGSYYTPSFTANASQIAGGGAYTLRADRNFAEAINGSGSINEFFNTAAFACPGTVTGSLTSCTPAHYGSASRYSIEGPGQLVANASLSRIVKMGDTRTFEARMTASNVFNTVQYSGINTTVNSATFGQVTGAATMRKIVFTARYRF
ncbi:MAG: TonB-dependent receptor [Acidobacteriaceae bacterium]|nr:TonB-dependent receptor [Acidobacteriaceae bacterium]